MKKFVIYIGLLFQFLHVAATHNRAGEITFKQISEFTYEITVVTYTSSLPGAADRPFLMVDFGDGKAEDVVRIDKIPLPNNYYWNRYVIQHTYPGVGTYEVVVEDPNRNYGINNIPNSVYVVFTIKTILKIDSEIGFNNTPVLLNPPIDRAALNYLFVHNPAAYDPDGDSLTFRLTDCLGVDGNPIPGYELPESSDTIYIETTSGNLIWKNPIDTGSYNVAMNVEEWRSGYKIGNITRDMQIDVYKTENNPPTNQFISNYCVQAGDTLEFEFDSFDENGDSMVHTLLGGPVGFELYPTDTLLTIESRENYIKSRFRWVTHWSHIRKLPYNFVVKTEDTNADISLVDIDNFLVKILGPAPENVVLDPFTNAVQLFWDKSLQDNIAKYLVYRNTESKVYSDQCAGGLPDSLNYVLVAEISDTSFYDDNMGLGLTFGKEYFYRVVAEYQDGSLSYPSKEVSTELLLGTPQIIQTSVNETSETNGSVHLMWHKPIIDETIYTGEFNYHISRFKNDDYELIDSNLTQLSDTVFIDTLINTMDDIQKYKIELYQDSPYERIGYSSFSTSMYLTLIPQNKSMLLNIKQNVPWENQLYYIYKKVNDIFELIDSTDQLLYTDTGLINKQEYLYKIKSKGIYEYESKDYLTYNWSNEKAGKPIDTEAPDNPQISIEASCGDYSHVISWTYESDYIDDITNFKLYYSNLVFNPLRLIDSVGVNADWAYTHYPELNMGGVYAVSAVDLAGNESALAKITAPDSCLYYELPNVFTPNGDHINDILRPVKLESRFIDKIELKIYNRTGRKVFETSDPLIEWDGKVNGKPVSSGVYYYVCDIYEKRSVGVIHGAPLTGIIYILMGDQVYLD